MEILCYVSLRLPIHLSTSNGASTWTGLSLSRARARAPFMRSRTLGVVRRPSPLQGHHHHRVGERRWDGTVLCVVMRAEWWKGGRGRGRGRGIEKMGSIG